MKSAITIMLNYNGTDNAILKCCESVIKRFHVNHLLRNSNATKEKGVATYDIFAFLMGLVFSGRSLFTLLLNSREGVPFDKNIAYHFLNRASVNWEKFLPRLSCAVVPEVGRLTSNGRRTALIVDDSPYYLNRSKKVDFLS